MVFDFLATVPEFVVKALRWRNKNSGRSYFSQLHFLISSRSKSVFFLQTEVTQWPTNEVKQVALRSIQQKSNWGSVLCNEPFQNVWWYWSRWFQLNRKPRREAPANERSEWVSAPVVASVSVRRMRRRRPTQKLFDGPVVGSPIVLRTGSDVVTVAVVASPTLVASSGLRWSRVVRRIAVSAGPRVSQVLLVGPARSGPSRRSGRCVSRHRRRPAHLSPRHFRPAAAVVVLFRETALPRQLGPRSRWSAAELHSCERLRSGDRSDALVVRFGALPSRRLLRPPEDRRHVDVLVLRKVPAKFLGDSWKDFKNHY